MGAFDYWKVSIRAPKHKLRVRIRFDDVDHAREAVEALLELDASSTIDTAVGLLGEIADEGK